MKKLLFVLVVALLFWACNDDPYVEPTPEKRTVSFGADFEDARVHLASGKTVWNATDIIGAFGEGMSNVRFTTSAQKLGTFSALISGNPAEYHLYYPYSETASFANGVISSILPATQELIVGTYASTLPLGSCVTSFRENVVMNNLCGVLALTVKSNIDRELTKVSFTSNTQTAVAGAYTANLKTSELTMAANGVSTVTLEGKVAMSADNEYKLYLILPPSTHENGFKISLIDSEGETFEHEFTKELNIKRSVITNVKTVIECNTEIIDEPIAESRAHWVWATSDVIVHSVSTVADASSAIDLSNGGQALANCYIVSAAGTYSIPAKRPDGECVDAENPNAVITFSTTGTEGNAVIAYTDENGRIIWSWHIWCTDAPANLKWGTNTFLDRNLGATSTEPNDVASYGLMYQWGRKDPFPGSKLYSWSSTNDETSAFSADFTATTVANTAQNEEYVWKYTSGSGLSISDAIAQPMHMCQNSKNTVLGDTTCTDGNKNYNKVVRPWVAAMCAVEYEKFWLDGTKTIYDPCPAGYMVPTIAQMTADFYDLSSMFDLTSSSDPKNNGASGPTWVPAAGYRTYDGNGKLFKVGTMGHYWSSTTYFPRKADHHYGATFYTMAIREVTVGTYGFSVNGQLKASETAAVRCVKMAE